MADCHLPHSQESEERRVPQLIYLCEKAFDEERFIEDVNKALEKENNIIVAVSEGVKDCRQDIMLEKKQNPEKKMYLDTNTCLESVNIWKV
ncbi:MAG: hypothetical protein ACLUTF_04660 [Anaerostipes hadrus]